jgi:vanillate O-demethylase monooxygenase subunit
MLDRPEITEAIFQDVVKAFAEDRSIIEAQQRNLNLDPHFKPVATAHDSGLNQARFIIKRRLQQEATKASPATSQKISP